MKKRIVLLALSFALSLSIVACSSGDNGKKVSSKKKVTAEQKKSETDSTTGEIVEENGFRKEPVVTEKELNKTGTTGMFSYSIDGIQISKCTATSDETAEILQLEKGKEVTVVAIQASAENTAAETAYFYIGQATLTTNTKEQVDPDIALSEYIDSEFLGNVIHSGRMVYILKNSNTEDITNISLHIDAPTDADFNINGEPVQIDITLE